MKYYINSNIKRPIYLQLYDEIKKDIINGIYKYGDKLPSKRIIAEELDISVIPVEHAYALLCDEGFIDTVQRSGYFVIYRDCDFIYTSTNTDIVLPQSNNTTVHNYFPYTILAKTMRKVLLDYREKILIKSPNLGCYELRLAISSYLKRSSDINVKPEQIIIGSGAEYLYGLILQLLGRDKIFALENPSYDKIQKVYKANCIQYDMLSLGKDGIKSHELEKTNATVLHITPFNSFPSGVSASASKKQEYINWAKSRNGFIIEDNYDSELTISKKNEDTIFSIAKDNHVIYLNTFSKTIAPSIRVGYMILSEKLLSIFEEKLGFYSCTVPVFEQYVLTELLQNGDFERHINKVRRLKRKFNK